MVVKYPRSQTLPLLLSLLLTPHATPAAVYVVTPTGVLQGTQDASPEGLPYFAFRGIPYAQPPVGDRRWKLPEPWPRFHDGVYQATEFKPACPQEVRGAGLVMDEDCLYLDVYVPHNVSRVLWRNATEAWERWMEGRDNQTASIVDPGSGDLPVLVWIHGGSYKRGSSSANEAGKMATEQQVVVVVIQYRLGALGFLSSGSDELPGNYGLWDQRLALKWVKDNIRGFGGDAAMVTAGGESAGAACVSQHTLSPRSRGLFRRGLLMSGTADAAWCFNPNPRDTFNRFSQHVDCGNSSTTSTSTRLSCLMTLPADVIRNASVVTEAGYVTFIPAIDGDFFPDDLRKLVQDEDYLASIGFYDYDLLVGTLNNEGVVALDQMTAMVPSLPQTGRFPYAVVDGPFLKAVLTQQLGPRHGPTTVDVVNGEYFYPRDPAAQQSVPVSQALEVYTDVAFVVPAVTMVRRHARMRSSPGASSGSSAESPASPARSGRSYMYFFDWSPSLTEGTMLEGMPHGLDVDYLWGLTNDSLLLYDSLPLGGSILPREHVVSRMFGDMIGAFVRTGDPNGGLPDSLKGQWTPYDVSNETFLRFGLAPSVDHHLHAQRVSLWVDLLPRLHSRWLNITASQGPGGCHRLANDSATGETTTPDAAGKADLTYFDLSESETNALLITLVVVCAVLLVCCGVLLGWMMMGNRRRKRRDSPGRG